MELDNSKRISLKANYVEIELTAAEQRELNGTPSMGLQKANYLRNLQISEHDIERLRSAGVGDARSLEQAQGLVKDEAISNFALARRLATIPAADLLTVGQALAQLRDDELTAFVNEQFIRAIKIAPVGRLHLERIEMVPAGTERGELIYTVPLTPRETVTVSHKEWATSRDEYEQIVSDSFESYSERGVAEKTDASMSAENETRHSSSLEFGAVTSAGYGPVSVSTSVGLNSSAEDRTAVKQSTQQMREITEKASARARQEHKVSVKLEKASGSEDVSYRTITNPFEDRALRVDYYRMMRKWRVDLFRYGLRLTYDVMVPTPALRLWRQYRKIVDLDAKINAKFSFELDPATITDDTWQELQKTYGVALESPPPKSVSVPISRHYGKDKAIEEIIEFAAPDGYELGEGIVGGIVWDLPVGQFPEFLTVNEMKLESQNDGKGFELTTTGVRGGARLGFPFIRRPAVDTQMTVIAGATPTEKTLQDWQQRVWKTLHDNELAKHAQRVAEIQEERDQLWRSLAGGDTLTLRRMEREELMRGILTWLIGPAYDATPKDVSGALKRLIEIDEYKQSTPDSDEDPAKTKLSESEWTTVNSFAEETVKFIHQAVEWENLLYFLYPYFWGSDDLARERLFVDHPDPGHRDFLRSGFARVVVPIRPGFEEAFVQLTLTGSPGTDPKPYLTIAEEIRAYSMTNYSAIPPANPERHARPQLYTKQRATWDSMQAVIRKLEEFKKSQGRYPAKLGDLPGAPFKDAWGREFVYSVPGAETDYELVSLGADGVLGGDGINADISAAATASLMSTWWEYTPSSGIDIGVTVNPLEGYALKPRPLLTRGARGPDVVILQKSLRKAGFDLVIDGSFEQQTEQAVRQFQKDRHLVVDGKVGPITWGELDELN